MTHETKTPVIAPAPSASRRRMLLAAGGALPSVLTLSSGAQAAAASSLRCLATNEPHARFVDTQDQWVRAQVPVGSYNTRTAYCVTSPSASCLDGSHNGMPGSNWVVDGNTMTVGLGTNVQGQNKTSYGLVYVDQTGSIMTINPGNDGNLTPVTKSCWTSVIGNGTTPLG